MTKSQLQAALNRERAKLMRQEDAVKATQGMIATLEQLLEKAK